MIIFNQRLKTMQDYTTWIQIPLLFILKLKMFTKTLLMMLKNDFIHQFMKSIDHGL